MTGRPVAVADKVKSLGELASILADLRAQGKRIVHCHGVFDLLHIGHLRHFESARKFGDVLVVTLTPDQWVNKGPNRPAFEHHLRAEMVASLHCVDYVAINEWPAAIETIKLLRPDFYVKGSDYRDFAKDVTGGILLEDEAIRSVGGQLAFTDELSSSSSHLINKYLSQLSREAQEFLEQFSLRHDLTEVLSYLDRAAELKVLVLGETIIDQYFYCETLGKSGKEPILAVRMHSGEKFAGGVLAVANHLAQFCGHTRLLTSLGLDDSQEAFIRQKLNPAVDVKFTYVADAPTIVKQRYIERYPFQKLFEVYQMRDDVMDVRHDQEFYDTLAAEIDDYDLVMVLDFGHGLVQPPLIDLLCNRAKCLAINTQANAGNHGFNTVSKYPRADYTCVSENELRLEARQRLTDLEMLVNKVATDLKCRKMAITRGRQGNLCYDRDEGFFKVPAVAGHFTDRVGAGDAVFAITSLLMAQNAPAEVLALVGSVVGAMAVQIVGNREPITKASLNKYLVSLFK